MEDKRLVRTYSENESSNFDTRTGVRLYDDLKYRSSRKDDDSLRLSRSHESMGMEDEYVPGFQMSLNRWFDDDEVVVDDEASLIKRLHTKVDPIGVPVSGAAIPAAKVSSSFDKLIESLGSPEREYDRKILGAIPANYYDMSFSERNKLVQDMIPRSAGDDYKEHISKLIKIKYRQRSFSSKQSSPAFRMSYAQEDTTKPDNINDRGSVVMGYKLGNIIGYGAWGTIRDCTPVGNTISRNTSFVSSYAPTRRSSLAVSYNSSGMSNFPVSSQNHAMKIINVTSPAIRARFRSEIEIWSLLHHPNILPLHDWLETNEVIFALTTRIYGGTLFELVRFWGTTPCTATRVAETKRYCTDVLKALAYMHSLGIVHGDIKLENCLMDRYVDADKEEKVRIMLCDFGMSQFFEETKLQRASSLTSLRTATPVARGSSTSLHRLIQSKRGNGEVIGITAIDRSIGPSPTSLTLAEQEKDPGLPDSHIGSLPYAAPENLKPNPPKLDYRADMWALGVMLYTMIVGKLPFTHQYEPRLRAMILAGRYDTDVLEQTLAGSPLLNVVYGCLEANTSKRISANEALAILVPSACSSSPLTRV